MIKEDIVKKWLEKAYNDIRTIEDLMAQPENEIVTDSVCFHCQQAIEKYLKAYLIANNIKFERTHDLESLLYACIQNDKEFSNIEIGNLTNYAVDLRYPDDFYIPSIDEAKEASKMAFNIKEFITKKFR